MFVFTREFSRVSAARLSPRPRCLPALARPGVTSNHRVPQRCCPAIAQLAEPIDLAWVHWRIYQTRNIIYFVLIMDFVQNMRDDATMKSQLSTSAAPAPAEALKQAGLQVTAQRIAVYKAVQAQPHAIADEICELARSEIGAISRQAVYDALKVLADHGLVRRIQPAGSAARFEDRVNDNHHHLACRQCGTVVDIDCAVGKAPCLQADKDHGFVIDEAEVIYWGLCPVCQTSENS